MANTVTYNDGTGIHVYQTAGHIVEKIDTVFGNTAISYGAGNTTVSTIRVTSANDSPLVVTTGTTADSAWTGTGNATLVQLLKAIASAESTAGSTRGTTADAAWTGTGNATLIQLLKAISVAETSVGNSTGTTADAAWTGTGNATLIQLLKAIATAELNVATTIRPIKIDQTTDGTTNKVNIDASLKSGSAARSVVASGVTSVTILAANSARKGGIICNTDANYLMLDFSGGTASSARYQVKLSTDQTYEIPSGFTGLITGIWSADGAGQADVVEFT